MNIEQFQSDAVLKEGYHTCCSFLLSEEPDVIAVMSDPVRALIEDDERALNKAKKSGLVPIMVPSPPAISAVGLKDLGSLPQWFWERFYPVNP